jgi:hypothetical protein
VSGAIRCLKASSSRWEVVNPAAKLEWLSQTVYSSTQNTAVRPLLSDRDKFPDGSREYEYILEYCFKAPQAGDVIVRFPLLNQMIYESVFGAQFYMLYDSQKRLIGTGDAHPEAIKLTAVGDYLVCYHCDAHSLRSSRHIDHVHRASVNSHTFTHTHTLSLSRCDSVYGTMNPSYSKAYHKCRPWWSSNSKTRLR